MTGALLKPRLAALVAIAVLVASASLVSFAESYRGLFLWAHEHGLPGSWAAVWPLQVDVFIAVGELALFVALADGWERRSRIGAWSVTIAGVAVSVAGNVGHVASHALTSHITAAVPPLCASAALAVGLGVLKRVVRAQPDPVPVVVPEAEPQAAAAAVTEPVPEITPRTVPAKPSAKPRRRANGRPPAATPEGAEVAFAALLAEGNVPSLRAIKTELRCGTDKARIIRDHLANVATGDTATAA